MSESGEYMQVILYSYLAGVSLFSLSTQAFILSVVLRYFKTEQLVPCTR